MTVTRSSVRIAQKERGTDEALAVTVDATEEEGSQGGEGEEGDDELLYDSEDYSDMNYIDGSSKVSKSRKSGKNKIQSLTSTTATGSTATIGPGQTTLKQYYFQAPKIPGQPRLPVAATSDQPRTSAATIIPITPMLPTKQINIHKFLPNAPTGDDAKAIPVTTPKPTIASVRKGLEAKIRLVEARLTDTERERDTKTREKGIVELELEVVKQRNQQLTRDLADYKQYEADRKRAFIRDMNDAMNEYQFGGSASGTSRRHVDTTHTSVTSTVVVHSHTTATAITDASTATASSAGELPVQAGVKSRVGGKGKKRKAGGEAAMVQSEVKKIRHRDEGITR